MSSKFIIADLSEPKSIPDELRSIIPGCPSKPVVPLINSTGEEYALSEDFCLRSNFVKPTIRYRDDIDVRKKIDNEVIPKAEAMISDFRKTLKDNSKNKKK